MSIKPARLATLALFLSAITCTAQNTHLGTWIFEKSEAKVTGVHITGNGQLALESATVPENYSITYEVAPDGNISVTAQGIVTNGQIVGAHWEWTGKFDGQDYPVVGDPSADTRAYKRIDDKTQEVTIKKDGNITRFGHVTISFKGKKCTVSVAGDTATYRRK
jgi:hypothetical protein